MQVKLNTRQSTDQQVSGSALLLTGALIERGTAADTGIDWGVIHASLANPDQWIGCNVNSGATNPASFLSLTSAAERTFESNRGAELIAYEFPGAGLRWCCLPRAMALVLRAIHSFSGVTADDIDARHPGLDARTRVSELRAGGFLIAGRRDPEFARMRRYQLIGGLTLDYHHIVMSGCGPVSAAMPDPMNMLGAICRRADQVAARTKANAAARLSRLAKRDFMAALPVQLDLLTGIDGEIE